MHLSQATLDKDAEFGQSRGISKHSISRARDRELPKNRVKIPYTAVVVASHNGLRSIPVPRRQSHPRLTGHKPALGPLTRAEDRHLPRQHSSGRARTAESTMHQMARRRLPLCTWRLTLRLATKADQGPYRALERRSCVQTLTLLGGPLGRRPWTRGPPPGSTAGVHRWVPPNAPAASRVHRQRRRGDLFRARAAFQSLRQC